MNPNFDRLFLAKQRPYRALVWSIAVVFFGFIVVWRLKAVAWDFSKFLDFSVDFKETIFTVFLSVLCSLIATILWALTTENLRESRLSADLNLIQSAADPKCLRSVLRELAHYKGFTHTNHSMRVRLEPLNEDFYHAIIEYRYKRRINSGNITFKIHRLTSKSDIADIPSPAEEFKHTELTWIFDERDMKMAPPIDQYNISNFALNQSKMQLVLRHERHSESLIYSAKLTEPNGEQLDTIVSFNVSFPIERESILALSYDVPTEDTAVHFDYTAIRDQIVVWSVDKVGLQEAPLSDLDNKGTISYTHNGWALPKDAYLFAWWKKVS